MPSAEAAEQIYKITREAMLNAARHANAQQIRVHVGRTKGEYFVTVEDDGTGFDASRPAPGGHFGLQVMQARAKHIGGRVELWSEVGRGTRVTLIWPVETGM